VEKIKWNLDIPKECLSSSEIKQLASTPYENNHDVYRAGLFSIYTGIRRSDILALRWENIHHDRGRKAYIRFRIKKTGTLIQLPLSLPAIRVLGESKSEGKIFPIITESILTIHIPRWLRKARIRKHITFHCFRHTFAMQLLDKGVDIYTIAALLGHRQVSSTQNYAKMSSKKMIEAIIKME
jgi:integrase